MGTKQALVKRILQLCKERGWTVYRLSIESGVPSSTVKNIVNGVSRNPGIVTIKKLCDAFGVSLGEFFSTSEFDSLEQEVV